MITYCLGIEFTQAEDSRRIEMHQHKYVMELLAKFQMIDAKRALTPMEAKAKFEADEEALPVNQQLHRCLIGSLLYAATATRPDIAYAISVLSGFNQEPNLTHWTAAKRVLRYQKGTNDYGLIFEQRANPLTAFVDADWGGSISNRKSRTGYFFKLAGAAITWESRKQKTMALSTTETEYIALSEAKEAKYIRKFLQDTGLWEYH